MAQDYQPKATDGRVGRIETARASRTGAVVKNIGIAAAAGALVGGIGLGAEALGVDVTDPATQKISKEQIEQDATFTHSDHNVYDGEGNPKEQVVIQMGPPEQSVEVGK